MPTFSPWHKILTAPTTSHAIQLALDLTPTALTAANLPLPPPELSAHARKNLHAVQRALALPNTPSPPSPWHQWHTIPPPVSRPTSRPSSPLTDPNPSLSSPPVPQPASPPPAPQPASLPAQQLTTPATPAVAPHLIQALSTWARSSAHTPPPDAALRAVTSAAHPPSVLSVLVPPEDRSEILAPLLRVLAPCVRTTFADHVMNVVVVPYAVELVTPAPRDVMEAVVAFAERHWRPALVLYKGFGRGEVAINGATAEMLVRVAAVLNDGGTFEALSSLCEASWGEDGIRVVESLLARCKNHDGVADVLIPALQANVLGSEKSVRFGKLLFTAAKEIPAIAATHSQTMEAICSRSKVFLSKRAIAILKSTKPNM